MVCPRCSHQNSAGAVVCEKCATPLPISDHTLATGAEGWSVPVGEVIVSPASPAPLASGSSLGTRYEIIRLLGQGGMGAVYLADDRELDRKVALKVIRADMAANPEILSRFKQELILARQITHRNVIRIFDLAQVENVKFITMEYVEGEDLQSVLRRKKKLDPAEAANIMAQVCRALEAAHGERVIHRDLKPQNIMLDKAGRVYVMDFGVARSLEAPAMTQTGALIGTPDYMSPEQAKGLPLDARSDLFTVGLIFYEMLTATAAFNADTTMGKLWKRTSEPPRPLVELDKTIPQALSDIVGKCLEIDPAKRFSTATELLHAIERWQGPPAPAFPVYAKWAAAGIAVALGAGGLLFREKLFSHPAVAPLTLLIADFDNKTGDSVFDGTLEPMLGIALEGAPFISSFNRGQARKDAGRLVPGTTRMDSNMAQLVAKSEGLNAVVTGSISQEAGGYRVYVTTLDAATGKSIVTEQSKASDKQDVLSAAGKLAERIRRGLGDKTPESAEAMASETFSTSSLEAAHAYAMAQDFAQAGKWPEAMNAYGQAIQFDPNMGRAYAGIAAAYANQGKRQDAVKYYELALAHIDRMTDRERYRTRGAYYVFMRNRKAVEELSALVSQYPADSIGFGNLALAYFYQRNMTKAVEEQKHALELSPRSVIQRSNFAMYALYSGDFDAAAKEAQAMLVENPKFDQALRTLALAELGLGHNEEAFQAYEKVKDVSAYGASISQMGLADLALYEGRLAEAAGILENAVSGYKAAKDLESAADFGATLALAQLALGKNKDALSSAAEASAASKDPGVIYRAAEVYLAAGEGSKALQLSAPLAERLEAEPQVYAKLIAGEVQLKKGAPHDALNSFEDAQKLTDTWLGHFDLGRAYLDLGAFPEASSEFDVCLKRRGEATSVFLDDVPSYHLLPPVYYYQGRARQGLNSPGSGDSYKAFLAIKEKGAGDPLVADARRRISSH